MTHQEARKIQRLLYNEMSPHVPSDELTLIMVPDPDTATPGEMWAFFHSFHAYTYWGGLVEANEAVAHVGEYLEKTDPDPETGFYRWPEPEVDLFRTEVFLQLRADRHQDLSLGSVEWDDMRERLRHLRWMLKQRAL